MEKPYDDRRVRWAIAYTINQDQVVQIGQQGAGMPTNVPFPVYPPLMTCIDSFADIFEKHIPMDYDLLKLEDLMKEAGFIKDSDCFWIDTYWANWPTQDNPYINGAPWHLTFPILLWNLKPTQ